MKRTGLAAGLVSATLFLLGPLPSSTPAQEMKPGGSSSKRAQELLQRFDKNGDGRLDDDERAEAKEAIMKEQIARQMPRQSGLPEALEPFRPHVLEMFDRNKDGQLDQEERMAAHKFAEEQLETPGSFTEELVRRFDRDRDGVIDGIERTIVDRYLRELRALGAGPIKSELLRRFDLNADGKIDDREWPELEAFVRPRIEASADQLRRYDTNHDGKLDDAEWKIARSAIMLWLNTPGDSSALFNAPPAPDIKPSAAAEQARLQAIANEVARRRAQREEAAKSLPSK
jgi:Ca2+-binding EF-hand superfamily protein